MPNPYGANQTPGMMTPMLRQIPGAMTPMLRRGKLWREPNTEHSLRHMQQGDVWLHEPIHTGWAQ